MNVAANGTPGADQRSLQATAGSLIGGDPDPPSFLGILPLLRCPGDGSRLSWNPSAGRLNCEAGTHVYPIEVGIPCLCAPNEPLDGKTDVTDIVKAFYKKTPLPSYDGLNTRDSLRERISEGVLGRLLDEQVSHDATILEVGCGIGQLTNFLGMGWGSTVIGVISA